MSRYVDIDKPRYVRYTDERSGEVVTSEHTIAELLDESIGLIGEDIVRCKDCIHCEYTLDDTWFCAKLDGIRVSADDFCSRGRRE